MSEKVELDLILKGGAKAVKTIGELEEGLAQAREEIKGVEKGSEDFKKLATAIQDASSEVKTLEKQMEGLEPQQKAEAFLKMGEGIAGGFAVAQGAMALAGVESEELEKLQVKVQSAIAIAQGVRMMSEAALMATTAKRVVLEKLALVRDKAGIVVTYARSIATGVWATAQGLLNKSISLTTVALKALKFAIAATGLGAIVIAIIAIGKAVYDWSKATKDLTAEQIKLAEATIRRNEKFLEERDLQKELAKAETDAEKRLIKKTKNLNKQLDGLKKTIELQKENKEALENTEDLSKEEIKTLKLKRSELSMTANEYKRQITRIDGLIVKIGEEIAAEEEAEQKRQERAEARKQRREERKAQREKDAEDLRALQEEEKRLTLERIADEETRELALLKFEKDLQLEKIKDATNFEEQRLLIEKKYLRDRKDIIKEHTQAQKDGLVILSDDAEEYFAELRRKGEERADDERARIEAMEETAKEFRATVHHQVLDQVRSHMRITADAKLSELDKQKEKEIELAEEQGKDTEEIEKKFQQKREQIEKRQKKIAVAQAIISTYESANQSYKSMSGIPFVGPALGAMAAGIAVSAGLANVRQILAQDVGGGAGGAGGGGGASSTPSSLQPSSTGEFTLGGAQEQTAVKAFVVESEITDSQAQMADINRRSTI